MYKQGTRTACIHNVGSQEVWLGRNFVYVLHTFAYFSVMRYGEMKDFRGRGYYVSHLSALYLNRIDGRRRVHFANRRSPYVFGKVVDRIYDFSKEIPSVKILLRNGSQFL